MTALSMRLNSTVIRIKGYDRMYDLKRLAYKTPYAHVSRFTENHRYRNKIHYTLKYYTRYTRTRMPGKNNPFPS